MSDGCAYCEDKNFHRMNPNIYDWCLLLKSEHLPPLNGISIDVDIQPPIEKELRFCGLKCLRKWIENRG